MCIRDSLAHDRTDERASGLDLAVTYLLGRVRICGDRLVDGRLQGAGVGHDCQVPGRDDILGVALAGQYPVDDLPRQLVVDRAGVDELLYGRDLRRRDVQLGQLEVRLVGASGQLTQPPLARRRCGSTRCNRRLDQVERGPGDDVAELAVSEAPLRLKSLVAHGRHLRKRRAQLLDPFPRRSDGYAVCYTHLRAHETVLD